MKLDHSLNPKTIGETPSTAPLLGSVSPNMQISRRHAVLIAALLPFTARATIPLRLPLATTIDLAKAVARIRIVSGHMLLVPQEECGARYVGAVIRTYKGDPAAKTLEFGPYYNLKVGGYYLVFLADGSLASENYASTNSVEQKSRAAFLQKCAPVTAPLSIMSFGHGVMPVDETSESPDDWSIDWQSLIEPPPHMKFRTSRNRKGKSASVAEFERVLRLRK